MYPDYFDEDNLVDMKYGLNNPFHGVVMKSFETKGCPPVSGFTDEPFPYDEFIDAFPEFEDVTKFSIKLLNGAYKQAVFFVPNQCCDYLDGMDRYYARFLLTAHMIILNKQIELELKDPAGVSGASSIGISNGMVTSSSVGGVSVSMTLPQSQNSWEYWLNQTKYGQKYLAFMASKTPVGVYFGGDDLRECFRD